jgi:hypothetical protein
MTGPAKLLSPAFLLYVTWTNLRRPRALSAQPEAAV